MRYAETPGQLALLASGLTAAEAARRLRVQVPYLRRLLRHGAPYYAASRLAGVLQCPIDVFLTPGGAARRSGAGRRGPGQGVGPAPRAGRRCDG